MIPTNRAQLKVLAKSYQVGFILCLVYSYSNITFHVMPRILFWYYPYFPSSFFYIALKSTQKSKQIWWIFSPNFSCKTSIHKEIGLIYLFQDGHLVIWQCDQHIAESLAVFVLFIDKHFFARISQDAANFYPCLSTP